MTGEARKITFEEAWESSIFFFVDNELEQEIDAVLKDIELSEEKFLRIVSLLRRLGRIPGGFDREWNISKIKAKIAYEPDFALMIAELLVNGRKDEELALYIPRYYLDALNYGEIKGSSQAARRIRYKRALIGTYGGRKRSPGRSQNPGNT
jgi:hypothetical protein